MDLQTLSRERLRSLSDDEFARAVAELVKLQQTDLRESNLVFYEPNQPNARLIHASDARVLGVGAGNRAGKTDNCMARWVSLATGIIPMSVWDELRPKFKGPLRIRVVVESLTTTLAPIILPKLQWWQWSGLPPAGGGKGHWGWIPRDCLLKGEWSKSWQEKTRILRVLCRNPDNTHEILGESTIQFMSFDQDATDFASGDFDIIHEDEPPPHAIHRENQARTMSVGGMMMLSMTWPDDPSIPVDWIFDEVYEPANEGREGIEWIELDTMENPHLDQESIKRQAEDWDEITRKVRIKGQPLRFSNRIHPLFTDRWTAWCYTCGKEVFLEGEKCPCGSDDVTKYCHVQSFDHDFIWPVVFLLDPHPRKPHMYLWAQILPNDDIRIVAEGRVEGGPEEVRDEVERVERTLRLNTVQRLMDPNMGRSPSGATRNWTWQDEFTEVGLMMELADDTDVGRARLNTYLQPDRSTLQPRITYHPRCTETITQMKRYVWDDHRRNLDKDLKQIPKAKNDDYPTLCKYLMNSEPRFRHLHGGAPIAGRRRAA